MGKVYNGVTKEELDLRLARFLITMNEMYPDWETAIILSKVNQYYFMGTMQDGVLIIKSNGQASYFVRRSFERARQESPYEDLNRMESYRDVASIIGSDLGNTYMETEIATLAILERLQKHFNIKKISSLDKAVMTVRSVKSPYELMWMERSGKQHHDLLTNVVPTLLREGMSEADFVAEIFVQMMKHGYQGLCRFSQFQAEMVVGQIGFGESSLYPTNFDGPGGAYGMCPAVPLVGSRDRKLHKGDLVFVDIAFGMNGYHSDKTQVYLYGKNPTTEIIEAHQMCMDVQTQLTQQLKPGAIPSEAYKSIMNGLSSAMKENFMGFGERSVKFLGHGVGLHIDEFPVIANGFHEPLRENMVISLEPKKGIPGIGMVGVEDTYIVTLNGGRCITGGGSQIIVV